MTKIDRQEFFQETDKDFMQIKKSYEQLSDAELESIKEDTNIGAKHVFAASVVLGVRRIKKGFDKGKNPIEPM